ncbi:unnamed protein product [Larinioides sclopetarius]|uniref:Uncharacterized protein n=1 Tax=Larinioides sclopetarius TaxID=280406 RepID=A0AAV1Z581_9ARAC
MPLRCPDIRCNFEGKLSDVVNYARTFSGFQNFLKVERKAAEECFDSFRNRLYEIGASCNYSADDSITLCRDYKLILCRKTRDSLFAHPE